MSVKNVNNGFDNRPVDKPIIRGFIGVKKGAMATLYRTEPWQFVLALLSATVPLPLPPATPSENFK